MRSSPDMTLSMSASSSTWSASSSVWMSTIGPPGRDWLPELLPDRLDNASVLQPVGNRVSGSGADGIEVSGPRNCLEDNLAVDNELLGINARSTWEATLPRETVTSSVRRRHLFALTVSQGPATGCASADS